jgi:thiol-disulfide isomerase/thioredoxin
VSRLPCLTRCAVPAAGRSGQPEAGPARHRARAFIGAAALLAAVLAAVGCDGGGIGASTPLSSGQSFVSQSFQTTIFKAGSRPMSPAVSGTTLAGRQLSLASYRGDVVVLNFWGSWCSPCRDEAPGLGVLARKTYASGVRFVGIDIRDEPDSALAFMQTFRVGYPSLNDPDDELALLFRSTVPPAAIPSTLVIDRSGRIAARIVGPASYSGLQALITEVAAERS